MRKALALGAVIVCGVGIAVAVASAGGRGQRLSDAYLAAAKAPCERFNSTVEPFRVGAGFDDLIRQIETFMAARAKLAGDLRELATADDDRRRVDALLDKLAEGNRILSASEALAGDGKFDAAFS